jgi:ParB-like chromosome segregation protein Spo0J
MPPKASNTSARARVHVLLSTINRVSEPDGKFEQAYGHHRIETALQVLGKNASLRLIIRDLDDETMLKMMAADNDDAYNLTPAFILDRGLWLVGAKA